MSAPAMGSARRPLQSNPRSLPRHLIQQAGRHPADTRRTQDRIPARAGLSSPFSAATGWNERRSSCRLQGAGPLVAVLAWWLPVEPEEGCDPTKDVNGCQAVPESSVGTWKGTVTMAADLGGESGIDEVEIRNLPRKPAAEQRNLVWESEDKVGCSRTWKLAESTTSRSFCCRTSRRPTARRPRRERTSVCPTFRRRSSSPRRARSRPRRSAGPPGCSKGFRRSPGP